MKVLYNIALNYVADRFEELTASVTTGLLLINMDLTNIILKIDIDWSYEVIRVGFSICASILSGYIVHLLKTKIWTKNNGNNSTDI